MPPLRSQCTMHYLHMVVQAVKKKPNKLELFSEFAVTTFPYSKILSYSMLDFNTTSRLRMQTVMKLIHDSV